MAHTCVLYTFLLHSTGISVTDGADIHGYSGKGVTITCSHGMASTNIKYFCREPCEDRDVLVKSDQSPTGRYTLKDHGAGTFTVSITDLQESDSGIYWCAVDRSVKDTYKKVKLTVSNGKNDSVTFPLSMYVLVPLIITAIGLTVMVIIFGVVGWRKSHSYDRKHRCMALFHKILPTICLMQFFFFTV
uniref:Immunoglobulin domain-containing protein n=1 Tax=Sinocyclocheilus rhinocerous TaxID=307959 RepID=A0A673GFU5_9TELE